MDKTLVESLEREGFCRSASGTISDHPNSIEIGLIRTYIQRLKKGEIKDLVILPERFVSDNPHHSEEGFHGVYVIYTKK